MKKENPNDVIVESGNLSNMPDRVGLVASILSDMGYDAVGVGETDIRTSGDEFFKQTAANKLTVLEASPDLHQSTKPYLVKNVDGLRVGVVSFGFTPPVKDDNEYARRKALYTAYKAARDESDILVVLDQADLANREWIERNEKRLGAPDIVVGGIRRQSLMQEEVVGKTRIVPTSMQGKHVGVVDIELTAGQEPKYALQRIPLESGVADDEAVTKQVKDFMAKIQQTVTRAAVPGTMSGQPVVSGRSGAKPYYPPVLCKSCHTKEYEDWAATKHASAVATLTSQQRAVPECLKCHSEMYRRLQRISITTGQPNGVECATCHMDSLPHGLERRNIATRVKVDRKACVECHDKEWSPNYEEKAYLAKISHVGAQSVVAAPPPPAPAPVVKPPAPPVRQKPPTPPPPPTVPRAIK